MICYLRSLCCEFFTRVIFQGLKVSKQNVTNLKRKMLPLKKLSVAGEGVLNSKRKNCTRETDFQQISLCALQGLIRNSTGFKGSGKSVSCGEKKEQNTWKEH